jgi:hypothetical protein
MAESDELEAATVLTTTRSLRFHVAIGSAMVLAGSVNTLSMKWMDVTRARGQNGVYEQRLCESLFGLQLCPDHSHDYRHFFDHPIFQTWLMFFGELVCLFVFKTSVCWMRCKEVAVENSSFNCLIFLFPALCDMTGSGMMIIGLTMSDASSFQMMRGAVLIFTSLLSVILLRKKLWLNHWIGMLFVLGGLFVIGVGDHYFGEQSSSNHQLAGSLLIVTAQVIIAIQMVYEERVVKKYNIPVLQAVGLEGVWGFTILSLLLVPFYYVRYSFSILRPARFENTIDSVLQVTNSWEIGFCGFLLIVSIALFNSCGMSVTKEMSATTRMVLDSVRTLFIWAFSLILKWETFQFLQPVGYLLLLMGLLVYYNLVLLPFLLKAMRKWKRELTRADEESPLLTGNESWLHQPLFGDSDSDDRCKVLNPPSNSFRW